MEVQGYKVHCVYNLCVYIGVLVWYMCVACACYVPTCHVCYACAFVWHVYVHEDEMCVRCYMCYVSVCVCKSVSFCVCLCLCDTYC